MKWKVGERERGEEMEKEEDEGRERERDGWMIAGALGRGGRSVGWW